MDTSTLLKLAHEYVQAAARDPNVIADEYAERRKISEADFLRFMQYVTNIFEGKPQPEPGEGEDPATEDALINEINDIIQYARDKKKTPPRSNIIDLIGHYLHEQEHFKTPDDTQTLYRYAPEAGIYRADGAVWVSTCVQHIVDSTDAPETASCHLSNEVVGLIKRLTFVSRETLEPPARYTPLNNGVYDFDENKLIPFTPDLFFTSKLAVCFDKNATCPVIDKFISEVCPNSTKTLEELAGVVIRRDNRLQKAWVFDGRGNNGKSTFLNLLTALVGKDNVSAVPLQKLEGNRFAAAELKDRYLNVVADLSDADLKTSGLFKAITGGDMLQAERKGQHPFRFYPFVKLVYSCNALPDATDDSNAYFRRWVLADFNEDFTGRENLTILDSLTTSSELSGLLNKGLVAAADALKQGKFTGQLDVAATRELYTLKANSAKAFLSRCIESDLDAATPKSLVWTAYLSFCKEHRLVAKTETAFWKVVKADFSDGKRTIDGNGRVNCIIGARLIDQPVKTVKPFFHPCSSKVNDDITTMGGDRKKPLTHWTTQPQTTNPQSSPSNGGDITVQFLKPLGLYCLEDGTKIGPFQAGERCAVPAHEVSFLTSHELAEVCTDKESEAKPAGVVLI